MDCTDAYREALTREFSSREPSAPTSTPTSASSRRQAAEADRDDDARQVLAEDAMGVEANDQD